MTEKVTVRCPAEGCGYVAEMTVDGQSPDAALAGTDLLAANHPVHPVHPGTEHRLVMDSSVDAIVAAVTAGAEALVTSEARPVFPMLQPLDWNRDYTVSRPISVAGRQIGFVGYGSEMPGGSDGTLAIEMVSATPYNAEQIEPQALAHLRARRLTWEWVTAAGPGIESVEMLACDGDSFADAKLLDPDFLREAQQILGSPDLAVGVPRRGTLLATRATLPKKKLAAFARAVAGYYRDADRPITHLTLYATDGELVGVYAAQARQRRWWPGRWSGDGHGTD